jgi:hypothetical protein
MLLLRQSQVKQDRDEEKNTRIATMQDVMKIPARIDCGRMLAAKLHCESHKKEI